jgi:hypothetical protein
MQLSYTMLGELTHHSARRITLLSRRPELGDMISRHTLFLEGVDTPGLQEAQALLTTLEA